MATTMMHETETGEFDDGIPVLRGRSIHARAGATQSLSVDQSDKRDQSVNKTMPYLVHLATLCGISIAVSLIGFVMLRDRVIDAETETRMLEYYVQQSDAELVKNGLKKPEDTFKFKQEH